MREHQSGLSTTSFMLLGGLVLILAMLLREQFVLMTRVAVPIRGDIVQYVAYADNLIHSAVFSSTWAGQVTPVPDSFRGPGYPVFLAAVMLVKPQPEGWYQLALHVQVVLGAATVLLGMALGRYWLSRGATLSAGMLIAIWPHHIAASGALLSEILFGFVLVFALWATVKATRETSLPWGWIAGLAFAYAYLINPLTLFFPPLIALVLWRGQRRIALCLLLIPVLAVGPWALRNSRLPQVGGSGRASMNLVQGSWPSFHSAWKYSDTGPVAKTVIRAMGQEQALFDSSPARGLQAIFGRMKHHPLYYLRWYALEKPYLLWDWSIRVGFGDIYFLQVEHSPWETSAALRQLKTALRRANYPIFLLAAIAALTLGYRTRRTPMDQIAPVFVALFFLYVTAIHVVFQSEPRYSIPYRPFELLLFVTAVSWLINRARGFIAGWNHPTHNSQHQGA